MRESIFRSAIRALVVTFSIVIGLCLGFIFLSLLISSFSSSDPSSKLTTVNSEEILPNAEGKREVVSAEAPVILQINIDGVIGSEALNAKTIRQQLIESREGSFKDSRVKGILVYINTPGGTATDAESIYHALTEYKKKYQVPVYAYTDALCASGGMFVAAAADKIYANGAAVIGSVGVIAPSFFNVSKLMEKFGVEALTISAGIDKDALNPLRPWKKDEDANFKEILNYYYDRFVSIVHENRPALTKEKLINEFGARVYPAPLAKEHGYIDVDNATLESCLTDLVQAAKIEGNEYQVIRLEDKNWFKNLFSGSANVLQGKVEHKLVLPEEVDLLLKHHFLYLYSPL